MKRFLLIMLMFIGYATYSNAEIQWYQTSSFAFARVYNGSYVWGNWETSDVKICINTNTDYITVYSPRTQVYKVLTQGEQIRDDKGKAIRFYVRDQDGDYGHIRLRIPYNGPSQIYIDFNDCAWCYQVRRI